MTEHPRLTELRALIAEARVDYEKLALFCAETKDEIERLRRLKRARLALDTLLGYEREASALLDD